MFEGQNSNTGFVYKDLKTVIPFEIGQYPISDVKMGRDTLNRFAEYQKQRFTEGYKARELVHYASEVIDDFLSRYFWHFFKDYKDSESINIHKNRMILYNCMTKAGFTNLESEYWHYDYGNRNWANITGNAVLYDEIIKLSDK